MKNALKIVGGIAFVILNIVYWDFVVDGYIFLFWFLLSFSLLWGFILFIESWAKK